MTALVLAETAQIDTLSRTVVLPRVCSWYLRDFCTLTSNNSYSTLPPPYTSNNSNGRGRNIHSNNKLLASALKSSGNSSALLPINCVKVIVPYLRESDRQVLITMLQDGQGTINIRFRPSSFRSRFLKRYVS